MSSSTTDFTLATTEEQYTPLHFAASYIPRYKIQQDSSGNQVQKSYLTSSKETVEFLVYTIKVEVGIVYLIWKNISIVWQCGSKFLVIDNEIST